MIEINELFSFFRHPQRYFFNRQLGIRFSNQDAKAEEREPFSIEQLGGYSIYQDWIETLLNDGAVSVKKMQAQGLWSSGVLGELAYHRHQQVITEFVELINIKGLGKRVDDLPVDIKIGSHHLVGKLSNRYENGLLLYRYANLKGKDFVIGLLHHLISQQVEAQTTHLLSADHDLIFANDSIDSQQLSAWLEIYQRGLQYPNAFFVEAAFAYVLQTQKKNAKVPPLEKAKELLEHAITKDYEPELKLLSRNIKDAGVLLNEDFEQQCQDLLKVAWIATQ